MIKIEEEDSNNSFTEDEFEEMLFIFRNEIEEDKKRNPGIIDKFILKRKIENKIIITNPKLLTEINPKYITKDNIEYFIDNKIKINTNELSINNEQILYDKINDIFTNEIETYKFDGPMKFIVLKKPDNPENVYYYEKGNIINYKNLSDKEKQYYQSKYNKEKLNFLKDYIFVKKYIFICLKPKMKQKLKVKLIKDKDFFINSYILSNLFDIDSYDTIKNQAKEEFDAKKPHTFIYRFDDIKKNKIKKFYQEYTSKTNKIFNEYFDLLTSFDKEVLKNNLSITPGSLFFEDIKNLNNKINQYHANELFDNCLPENIINLYNQKTHRIHLMSLFKIIQFNYEINLTPNNEKLIIENKNKNIKINENIEEKFEDNKNNLLEFSFGNNLKKHIINAVK